MSVVPGTLYVVATPIGNLGDLGARARDVLAGATLVAAEDTRHAGQLLTRLGISARLVSLHEHNEAERSEELLTRLGAGDSVALISDAGTPLISDPGYRLLAGARRLGVPVSPIPGCCAAVAALSVAGLPASRFHFEGFLPARAPARRARLATLGRLPDTWVCYEAVHRIEATLTDAVGVLGGGRPAALGRELTKLHETLHRGTLQEILTAVAGDPSSRRGEYTLVVGGHQGPASDAGAELARVVGILGAELPPAQAATLAAKLTGASRREAYRLALGRTDDGAGPGA